MRACLRLSCATPGEGETACEGGTRAGDDSMDEQEREWERVQAEITASLESSSAAHKRSTSSGGQSLPRENPFSEEQPSPANNEGQVPYKQTLVEP